MEHINYMEKNDLIYKYTRKKLSRTDEFYFLSEKEFIEKFSPRGENGAVCSPFIVSSKNLEARLKESDSFDIFCDIKQINSNNVTDEIVLEYFEECKLYKKFPDDETRNRYSAFFFALNGQLDDVTTKISELWNHGIKLNTVIYENTYLSDKFSLAPFNEMQESWKVFNSNYSECTNESLSLTDLFKPIFADAIKKEHVDEVWALCEKNLIDYINHYQVFEYDSCKTFVMRTLNSIIG